MKPMSRPVSPTLAIAALVIASLAAPAALAQSDDDADRDDRSIEVTVRLGALDGDTRVNVKSYDIVVLAGGAGSRLLSGTRTPIPSGTDGKDVVYQNVGFSSEIRAWLLDDGRIEVAAVIEDSRLVREELTAPPLVETRQLEVQTVLKPGEPLEVTRVQGILDRAGFVEIEASVLD